MARYKVDLSLHVLLASPLHIGTGYGYAGYLDAVMTTDAQGYPYIPGSSLKGRLRYYASQFLELLATEDAVHMLFGSREKAGSLFFDNCPVTDPWKDLFNIAMQERGSARLAPNRPPLISQRQSNVMISRLRGVALERHLFSVESAPSHLAFAGRIHGLLADETEDTGYPYSLGLLVAAIQACDHLGGRKSRGLGRCRLEITALTVNDHTIHPHEVLEALE